MKTVVLAYHNIGCVGINALLNNDFEIAAVFTHRDDPQENLWFDSVSALAATNSIPVFAPNDINNPIWIKKIKTLNPDIIFSFYYRKMIGSQLLGIPPLGCINLHGSLLPKYRGRCPVNWALANGEKQTGVSLHYMTELPDDGDIICQKKIDISASDTAQTLNKKLANASLTLLDEILPKIKEKTAPRYPQDHRKATYFTGRRPEDGEIKWELPSFNVRNLVRAVTLPYPGAFSYIGNRKCFFWDVTEVSSEEAGHCPGTVISETPLVIACRQGAVRVNFGQMEGGLYMTGVQLAGEAGIVKGMKFGPCVSQQLEALRKKRVLILGVDGFIGNALSERLLESGKYEVHGMDLRADSIKRLLDNPGFHFDEADISVHREWIEYHIKKCDIVLPLVAIATPIEYTRNPLKVFELDFEENLKIVRYCVKYKKRIIFPSTSEVYGMCDNENFNEDSSHLVLGPIKMQRWIYSCCKQLLDRVIWAYGKEQGLKFTLFRPFNWIGPRLDSLDSARIGSSRVITQLILNLIEGTPIQLIDGGNQKRCFTNVWDGVECLFRIIENVDNACDGQIINIGAPDNEISIKGLALMLVDMFEHHELRSNFPPFAGFRETESKAYYGEGYQDAQHRKPCIQNARRLVNWSPEIDLEQSVAHTLDFFIKEKIKSVNNVSVHGAEKQRTYPFIFKQACLND